MATIKRFEDLEVWNLAKGHCGAFYKLAADGAFKGNCPRQDQIDRSSASVIDNITKGFDRHPKAGFRAQLYRTTSRNLMRPTQFETLRTQSEQLSIKRHHFIGYLSRTAIKEKPTPTAANHFGEEVPEYGQILESQYSPTLPDNFFLSIPQNIA